MATFSVTRANKLTGHVTVPGDKSISHRAILLGALAQGQTRITNFLASEDCLQTVKCVSQLGVDVALEKDRVIVNGKGLYGLQEPSDILNVGNSGTTIRLISGILAGQPFASFITGDASIRQRPMKRITEPLKQMGVSIIGREQESLAPLAIQGGNLKPITYLTETASAQVKSAILLAGLFTPGWTSVTEPAKSRDHTELMLQGFGVPVEIDGMTVRVKGQPSMAGCDIQVPGDISSAAFLIVAASIVPRSRLILKNVGLNPSRTGIIEVLQAMGANIQIMNQRVIMGEILGDICVESSRLKATTIAGDLVVRLIDEIPILAVAAGFAEGITEIRDAAELRFKESNRIGAIVTEYGKLGMDITELPDGLRIKGGNPIKGALCSSQGDHRIALSLAIAGLMGEGETLIEQSECIAISFPNFEQVLTQIGAKGSEVQHD